jgi:hypothetical protein
MDKREEAWVRLHEAMPARWTVGQPSYDPGVRARRSVPLVQIGAGARSPRRSWARAPIRWRPSATSMPACVENMPRARGAWMTTRELEGVVGRFPGVWTDERR